MIERLSIVPVAVSYELDPCDELKAHELVAIAEHGVYRKAPGEDLRSIITGVTGRKGRVHLSVGPAFSGTFNDADSVAAEIDRQIARGYRSVPDTLHGGEARGARLSEARRELRSVCASSNNASRRRRRRCARRSLPNTPIRLRARWNSG